MKEDIKLIAQLNKDWRLGEIKVKRAGGQTNRNYIVQYKNKKFFVRFPWERTDIVNREIEAKNILAISKCKKLVGIVPKYFLYVFKGKNILSPKDNFDFPDGTVIMEYTEGRDIDGKDLKKEKIQKALVDSLYRFHASGVKFVNIYDVFRDEVAKYRKKAKKYPVNKLLNEEKIRQIEDIEKKAKENFPLGGSLSTHNDLIFDNLRLGRDGKIYILDFEYAGYNVRNGLHYDLGIILGGNLFCKKPITTETFEKIFKKAEKIYKKNLNERKIYYGALTNILVMFWWGVVKYFSSSEKTGKKYFKKYVLDRAKRIEELFKIANRKY